MPPDLPAARKTYSGRASAKNASTWTASVSADSPGGAPMRRTSSARSRSRRAAPSRVSPPATNTRAPAGNSGLASGRIGVALEGRGGQGQPGGARAAARVGEDDLAAVALELERHLHQVGKGALHVGVLLGRHEQQQEAAAAGAGQFAADRPR